MRFYYFPDCGLTSLALFTAPDKKILIASGLNSSNLTICSLKIFHFVKFTVILIKCEVSMHWC